MEKILLTAFEAEQTAQKKIAEALEEKARLDASAAEADKIIDKYRQDAEKRVSEFEESENARVKAECGKLEKRCAERVKRLREQYEKNADAWLDELFESVTE